MRSTRGSYERGACLIAPQVDQPWPRESAGRASHMHRARRPTAGIGPRTCRRIWGAATHLAHPLGVKAFSCRRVKNDVRDATDLADLLRMGRLPQAWIAPPATRELRELVRHRAKLVALRSGCQCEVHAVLAKCGIQVLISDLWADPGSRPLKHLDLPAPYLARVGSLRRLIDDPPAATRSSSALALTPTRIPPCPTASRSPGKQCRRPVDTSPLQQG